MYPPFVYLTSNLNYNNMINYENSKCNGGDDGSGRNSSSSGGSGTATNSPSYYIVNDDIVIFNRINREDLIILDGCRRSH